MTIEFKTVTVTKAPAEDLDLIRPHAVRDGHSDQSDAAVARYALIELAKRIRREGITPQRTPRD